MTVEVLERQAWSMLAPQALPGECLDDLPLVVELDARLHPEYLRCGSTDVVDECLHSHLLKSNCPVTGQPDWGSVSIRYRGAQIDRAGLLRYLLSFREICEFHEHCVERIFVDVLRGCAPQSLTVEARYTRRGGLDINPYRANDGAAIAPDRRQWRQ